MRDRGPDPERETPPHAQRRFFSQQVPAGSAMEFPDLGAHCSEPSCQRLGEGRSARGAGPGREGLGVAGGAKGGLRGWQSRRRAGTEVGGGGQGGVA